MMKKERFWGYSVILVLIVLTVFSVYSYFDDGVIRHLFDGDTVKVLEYVNSFQNLAFLVFIVLIFAECVLAPFPPLILYIVGGAIFGGFRAGMLAMVGNILGAAAAFQISRQYARNIVKNVVHRGRAKKLDRLAGKYGPISIFILRINPITSSDIFSYVAGLTKMNFRKFLFWTTLALIPTIFLQTYLGAAIQSSPWISKVAILGGSLYFILFIIGFFILKKKKVR